MKDEKEEGSTENSKIRAEKEGKREKEVGRREQGKKRGKIERREVWSSLDLMWNCQIIWVLSYGEKKKFKEKKRKEKVDEESPEERC